MIAKLPPLPEVLDLMPDAVCIVDAQGCLLFVNASFERIIGYPPDEVLQRPIFDLVHPDDRAATREQAEAVTGGLLQRHFRNRYIHKDGHSVDIQWSARWLPDYGVRIGVGHEVTELRRIELEIEHRASHDPLTGLFNRYRLQTELQHAISHAEHTGNGFAVLYLDVDGFKGVNDRDGHDAGDRVLREIARRLRTGLRQGDLVARIGGDEFVVVLQDCRNAQAAQVIAEGLRTAVSRPFSFPGGLSQLDVSVGIARFPADGDTPDALLMHADRAMYTNKRQRRSGHGF